MNRTGRLGCFNRRGTEYSEFYRYGANPSGSRRSDPLASADELYPWALGQLTSPADRMAIGQRAAATVASHRGALTRTLDALEPLLRTDYKSSCVIAIVLAVTTFPHSTCLNQESLCDELPTCRDAMPVFVLLIAFQSATSFAEELADGWTRFRGENGNGVLEECKVRLPWTDDQVLARIDLPANGNGSPAI